MKIKLSFGIGLIVVKLQVQAGDILPPGVPRIVETNGDVLFIESQFTTLAYQNEALRFVMAEANKVAAELQLQETLPLTTSNLTHAYICPFGYSYMQKCVGAGNITTSNYWYSIKDDKLSEVSVARIDDRCRDYAIKYQIPISRLNTNAAYILATQWLAAAHMDVASLNRDFDVQVAVDGYWNNVNIGDLPKKRFTPLYIVSWLTRGKPAYSAGGGASVELFLPAKTLLSLSVDHSKYILRPPVVFTNLTALFPGKATITTNWPTPIRPLPFQPADSTQRSQRPSTQ